jgi:hypothetical protein
MEILCNAEIFESPVAIYWFNENGILYSKAKNVSRTVENARENFHFLKQLLNTRKMCLLLDTTNLRWFDRETCDYMQYKMSVFYKAIAVISYSYLGKINANHAFKYFPSSIPVKIFSTEQEAVEWLKQYV